jgi:hypothetical protein
MKVRVIRVFRVPDCDTRNNFGFCMLLPEIPEQNSGFGYFGFGFGYSGFGFRVTGFLPSPTWNACNPLLQAHPTWARDEHEGRGISTSLTPSSPLRARPRADPSGLGHAATSSLVGPGTPRSRNADKDEPRHTYKTYTSSIV